MRLSLFIWPAINVALCAFLGIRIGIMIAEKTYTKEGRQQVVNELCQRQNYDFCVVKDEIIEPKEGNQ